MTHTEQTQCDLYGVGLGFRTPHLHDIFALSKSTAQQIPWFEVLTDNYLNVGGFFAAHLTALGERYPLSFHGVGLSIGSYNGPDRDYLAALKKLTDQHQPVWVSDHLSWSNLEGVRSHDLLPMVYDENTFNRLCNHINQVQDYLNRPIMLENISAYIEHKANTLSEPQFLNRLCKETGCFILLDLNNLYVNQENLGRSADAYLDALNINYVKQLHLGGHEKRGKLLVDTHGSEVCMDVWQLFESLILRYGIIPTLIEWDNNIPEFSALLRIQQKATSIMHKYEMKLTTGTGR